MVTTRQFDVEHALEKEVVDVNGEEGRYEAMLSE